MKRLAVHLLGSFQVTSDGDPVTEFHADTARALLAYLVMHPANALRREALAGLLWPEQPEREARHNLSAALCRVREVIGDRAAERPFLEASRETIQLSLEADYWLDVAAFAEAVAATRGHPHRRLETCDSCAQRLQEAAGLYQGDFLSGFSLPSASYEEWLVVERERLHQQALEVLHALSAYHAGRQAYEQAIHYARRQVELEPWREEAHRQWMHALAMSGQRSAALAQYETCRRILREELDVEPGAETTALYERIRDGVEDLSGLRSLTGLDAFPPHNLPAALTPFIGREALLAQVTDYLLDSACRLLTLTGPGGSGKTRLAVEAVRHLVSTPKSDRYPDGAFYVSLAPLQSADALVPAIAQAIGLTFYGAGELQEQLLGYLRGRQMLLILDNYEHLLVPPASGRVEEGTGLPTEVLRAAPGVKIVVTSRTRLNLHSEWVLPVGGMRVPPSPPQSLDEALQYSAVQLFLSSARQARPGYAPTADEVADVAAICRLVDGMPLAILLAVAWIAVLSPAEIAQEIGRSIDFLEAELRDLPERQRSLRAVYNHSWQLLSGREREVFEGTSVFRGSFTREAAKQVAGASLRELVSLVNRSLLQRTSTGRYEVHELLRQYAAEQLRRVPGASQATGDRHCAYYMGCMQQWAVDLRETRQGMALTQMREEMDNVRVAWRWAEERGQATRLEGTVEGLCRFHEWYRRQAELVAVFRVTAAELEGRLEGGKASADQLRLLAKILAWGGCFLAASESGLSGWSARSLELLERPELAGQDLRAIEVVALADMVSWEIGRDPEEARHLYERSLALCQALGDPWLTANTLRAWGMVVWQIGAYDEARQALEKCLSLCQVLGDRMGEVAVLFYSGTVALQQERFEEAERCARENVALRQAIGGGDPSGGLSLQSRAVACLGRFDEARILAEKPVAFLRDLGNVYCAHNAGLGLGYVEAHLGRYDRARALARAALDYYRRMEDQGRTGTSLVLRGIARLGLQAGEEAQRDLERGPSNLRVDIPLWFWAWPLPRDPASVPAARGYAERAGGTSGRAAQAFCQALRMAAHGQASLPVVTALPGAALLLADRGEVTRAVELYALARRHPFVANSRWFQDVAGRELAHVAASLPPEAREAAQARGRARDLWATARELLEELGA